MSAAGTLHLDLEHAAALERIAAHLDLHIDHEPAGDAAGPGTPPVPASPPATNQPRDDGADDQP